MDKSSPSACQGTSTEYIIYISAMFARAQLCSDLLAIQFDIKKIATQVVRGTPVPMIRTPISRAVTLAASQTVRFLCCARFD